MNINPRRLRLLFIAMCLCFVQILSGKASVATDMRLMNMIQTDSLFHQGEEAMERRDMDDALNIFTVVCSRDDRKSSRLLFSKAHQLRGNILSAKENYAEAIQAYLQARAIAEHEGFSDRLPSIYINIGNVFSSIGDLDTGISFYQKALSVPGGDEKLKALPIIYNNLLYAYYLKADVDSARKYYEIDHNLGLVDSRSHYDLILNRGLIYELEGKAPEARERFRVAADFARDSLKSPECEAAAKSHIAYTYERENVLDSALVYLHSNEAMARIDGYNNLLVESLRDLARVYECMGRRTESLLYKSEYLSMSDSLFSRENLNFIKNSQALYEQNADAYTIRTLNTTNALQRHWIIALFVIITVIAFLSVSLWRQKRKLSNAWKGLYERNLSLLDAERHYTGRIAGLEERLKEMEENCLQNEQQTMPPNRKPLITTEQRRILLDKICHVMESSDLYCDPEFSIDRLAAAIDSNSRYVSEMINTEYGINFRTFLNKYRVKEAMRRLEVIENYGHFTIKTIGESVGYKYQATFISVFTKETGLKPSLYQQLSRNRRNRISEI